MKFFNSKRWGLTTLIASVIIAGLLLIPGISKPVMVGAITHVQAVAHYFLNDLVDVNVPAPTDNYIIYWNNTSGYWEARAESGGAFACSDLDNCTISALHGVTVTPTSKWIIFYNISTSEWESQALSNWDLAELGTKEIDNLDDVNAPAPNDGDILFWNNTASEWQPKAESGGSGTKIEDGDSDTKVDVEENADEDMVRMDVGGTQAFVLDSAGIRSLPQQAASLGYRNGNVNIPTITLTKIILNAESYDVQNEFDTTNGTYTASTSGSYLVVAKLRYTTSLVATKRYMNYIYRNGVQLVTTGLCFAGGDAIYVQNVAIVSLSADDYLELWTWQNSGAQANIRGLVGHTEMAIYKLG